MGFAGRPGADQAVEGLDVKGRHAGFAEEFSRLGIFEAGQVDRLEKRGFAVGLLDQLGKCAGLRRGQREA